MGGQLQARLGEERRRRLAGRERQLAALSARQHGVIARRQLLAAGLSGRTIERRIEAGRLHPLHQGVYAVGHERLSQRGRWMAAVLACGERAVLSHRSAAALWGLTRSRRGAIEVCSPRGRSRRGVVVRKGRLDPADRAAVAGIPVTSVARTLLDLAEVVDERRLEGAFEEADRLGLLQMGALEAVCRRGRGRRGLRPIRPLIEAAREPVSTGSPLENRFAAFCREQGLPPPLTNVLLCGREVDALWPRQRLVVELDGYAFHRHRAAFERDRARDAAMQAAGYRVLRVTHRRLERDRPTLAAQIRRLLRQAGGGPAEGGPAGSGSAAGGPAAGGPAAGGPAGSGPAAGGPAGSGPAGGGPAGGGPAGGGAGAGRGAEAAGRGSERGQATLEWVGLIAVVALLLAGIVAAGVRLPGASLARAVAQRILCAAAQAGSCGDEPALIAAYGTEVGGLARRHMASIALERGSRALPVDFRRCRSPACGDGTARGLVRRTGTGLPVTAFVHAIDCRPGPERSAAGYECGGGAAGNLYLQYWTYYADSATLRGVPVLGAAGYHRDDWESVQIRIRPGGEVDQRASSHRGFNHARGAANLGPDAGIGALRQVAEALGARAPGGWGQESRLLLVSGGSHAGSAGGALHVDRLVPGRRVRLVPLEPIAAGGGRYRFAVSPPWRKRAWRDPEAEGTD